MSLYNDLDRAGWIYPIAAVGLNNDATEKPVVPKEEETPVDNAKLLGISSLPWDKQCCWDLPHGSRS